MAVAAAEEEFHSQGDKYFRTGDLLRKSPEGYYYFADRCVLHVERKRRPGLTYSSFSDSVTPSG